MPGKRSTSSHSTNRTHSMPETRFRLSRRVTRANTSSLSTNRTNSMLETRSRRAMRATISSQAVDLDPPTPDPPTIDPSTTDLPTTDAPTTPPSSSSGDLNALTPATRAQLHVLLRQASGSYSSAEAAVISLMHKYQFSFDDLRRALTDEQLDVSFSKAKYSDIAALYNLNPDSHMWDAKRFKVTRARLPTEVLQRIVTDVNQMLQVYGPPELHGSEVARSRFLAPLWNHVVAKFGMLIRNTPESMLEGRITSQGRIEYQFRAFGSLTVLFIELKMFVGDSNEKMNAIAQVLAEGDACDYDNFQKGYNLPVYGILSDGTSWMFFRFHRTLSPGGDVQLNVLRGALPAPGGCELLQYSIPPFESSNSADYVRALRPACEYIYSLLLAGFLNSLDAFYTESKCRDRASTSQWFKCREVAGGALEKAVKAAKVADRVRGEGRGGWDEANAIATEAWEEVSESVRLARAARP
ncbi:hypothetical protein K440DRAFT_615061 [Wilcoxina mikolae CBS 423.85]|nr:hypothetical protein K440DRAFT_615061 [Wilcoxina mikolae CBS 423.85]